MMNRIAAKMIVLIINDYSFSIMISDRNKFSPFSLNVISTSFFDLAAKFNEN